MSSKKSGFYREYLIELKNYLVDFLDRTRPLHDVNETFAKTDAEFEKKWEEGIVRISFVFLKFETVLFFLYVYLCF